MKYITGLGSLLFVLCAPLVTIGGLLIKAGLDGPVALLLAAIFVTGGWLLYKAKS